jgi:hypothetical protein
LLGWVWAGSDFEGGAMVATWTTIKQLQAGGFQICKRIACCFDQGFYVLDERKFKVYMAPQVPSQQEF